MFFFIGLVHSFYLWHVGTRSMVGKSVDGRWPVVIKRDYRGDGNEENKDKTDRYVDWVLEPAPKVRTAFGILDSNGKALDVIRGRVDRTEVGLWPFHGDTNQQFRLVLTATDNIVLMVEKNCVNWDMKRSKFRKMSCKTADLPVNGAFKILHAVKTPAPKENTELEEGASNDVDIPVIEETTSVEENSPADDSGDDLKLDEHFTHHDHDYDFESTSQSASEPEEVAERAGEWRPTLTGVNLKKYSLVIRDRKNKRKKVAPQPPVHIEGDKEEAPDIETITVHTGPKSHVHHHHHLADTKLEKKRRSTRPKHHQHHRSHST